MNRDGLLLVVSGPSGTGKGTVLNLFKELSPDTVFSISATTRTPRKGEADGKNYFFKSLEEFERMIEDQDMVEWVQYCGNYYGTPKCFIDESIKSGKDVILEIEVEGALNIKKLFPKSVIIFIAPPTFEELRRRIESRGTEDSETIARRLEKARKELLLVEKYDYVIVNEDVQEAVNDLLSIIHSEKLRVTHCADLQKKFFNM